MIRRNFLQNEFITVVGKISKNFKHDSFVVEFNNSGHVHVKKQNFCNKMEYRNFIDFFLKKEKVKICGATTLYRRENGQMDFGLVNVKVVT